MRRFLRFLCLSTLLSFAAHAQSKTAPRRIYCNPLNLDYGYTPIPEFATAGRHRATADPVITRYKGDYYLFATNQWGYWWSPDLSSWKFVPRHFLRPEHKVYDDLCAPAVFVLGDTLLVYGSTHEKNFPIRMSTNPKVDDWKKAIHDFQIGAWDPDFFLDTDGRLYLYWGSSSNLLPLYGQQISRKTCQPIGEPRIMFGLNDKQFGWPRFGEYLDNTFLAPFMEGAWMTKHNGRYYLQYGAPGTEFSGYPDGVQMAAAPLGPFTPQLHNPFAYKPGGFARGAGHGNTFQDAWNGWWHVSTMVVNVKDNFERRLGLWPAGFDAEGTLYCNTAFGDYPHYLPTGPADHLQPQFTGWILLSYQRPVRVSSTLGGSCRIMPSMKASRPTGAPPRPGPASLSRPIWAASAPYAPSKSITPTRTLSFWASRGACSINISSTARSMAKTGSCWSIKAGTKWTCRTTISRWPNPSEPAISNSKTDTCPPANLPSAGCEFLASAAGRNRRR